MPESPTQAFQALGNAVNTKVVEWVASALLDAFKDEKDIIQFNILESGCVANNEAI